MMDCRKYFEVTGRRITLEYTLIAGINDSIQQVSAPPAARKPSAFSFLQQATSSVSCRRPGS